MAIINNGNITLCRGDSITLTLDIYTGSNLSPDAYVLTANDTVYFAVMAQNQVFENATIKKVFTSESETSESGQLLISLRPQDTEMLTPGMYKYTVKLKTDISVSEYDVTTIVPEHEFYIM